MRYFASLFIMCIITSCNYSEINEKQAISAVSEKTSLNVSSLDVGAFSFAGLYTENQISGSNPISQAQSKAEWILAAKNKRGAWCYIDTLNKLGVLYNGYCLNDTVFTKGFLLADSIYQDFENNIKAKFNLVPDDDTLLMIERNANGNFYNLGYHSFWVAPEVISGNHLIISVDARNGETQVRSVNAGNGYFIRLLK